MLVSSSFWGLLAVLNWNALWSPLVLRGSVETVRWMIGCLAVASGFGWKMMMSPTF